MQFKLITSLLLLLVAQTMAAPPSPQDKGLETPSGNPPANLAHTTPSGPPPNFTGTTPPGPKPTDIHSCHEASECPNSKDFKCCLPPKGSSLGGVTGVCTPVKIDCPV